MVPQANFLSRCRNIQDSLLPVILKERNQYLRSNTFVFSFVLVQIAALISLLFDFVIEPSGDSDSYWAFLLAVFVGVMPLTFFKSLHIEVAGASNAELLLMSGLTRWQIVLGKWMTANVIGLLLLFSIVPYGFAYYYSGNSGGMFKDLFTCIHVIAANLVMNAIVIAASGFQNHITKIFVILFSLFVASVIAAVYLFGVRLASGLTSWFFGAYLIYVSIFAIATVVTLNFQLGRACLRPFEVQREVDAQVNIFLLIALLPVGMFVFSLVPPALVKFLSKAINIDPTPSEKCFEKGLQP